MYGLAIYCPSCGQLAPAQQLVELVRVQRDRLAALDRLDAPTHRNLLETGVITSIYESTPAEPATQAQVAKDWEPRDQPADAGPAACRRAPGRARGSPLSGR